MTIKLIALYRKPDNVDNFIRHYHEVHLPLVAKTPHLLKVEISEVTGSPMGDSDYFYMAQMSFPDKAKFDEAMRSPENRAAGKDLMSFARDLVTMIVVREVGVELRP